MTSSLHLLSERNDGGPDVIAAVWTFTKDRDRADAVIPLFPAAVTHSVATSRYFEGFFQLRLYASVRPWLCIILRYLLTL